MDKQILASLDSGAPLQVVLDVLRVGAVEPLALLVELHVPLVDVVDVRVGVVAAAPGEGGILGRKWKSFQMEPLAL